MSAPGCQSKEFRFFSPQNFFIFKSNWGSSEICFHFLFRTKKVFPVTLVKNINSRLKAVGNEKGAGSGSKLRLEYGFGPS